MNGHLYPLVHARTQKWGWAAAGGTRSHPNPWCNYGGVIISGLGPDRSDGHGGQSDEGIIAHGRDGFQGHVGGTLDGPFVLVCVKYRPNLDGDSLPTSLCDPHKMEVT